MGGIMNILEIIILGIIQGITEFLPISSSGHLVIAQNILGIKSPGNTLEVLFHFGTLMSVVYVFFEDLKQILLTMNEKNNQSFIFYIIIATLPAVFSGLLLKDYFLKIFDNVHLVGFALCSTGFILILSKRFKNNQKAITFSSSIAVGIAQAIAIIPGISRSGSTISMCMYLGIPPKEAARFSFLLSIPVILGASILGFLEVESNNTFNYLTLTVAITTSFFTGVIALKILLKILENGRFYFFGFYCLIAGFSTIFI
jgi:undecaprenyl-diphosphatase